MSTVRLALLTSIEAAPGRTAHELADELGWEPRYTRKHLDKARLRGLVTRQSTAYWLTRSGQSRLDFVRENGLVEDFS